MKLDIKNKKKLVIKIGSSLLVEDGNVREKWLKSFAKDVSDLVKKGFKIAIVSSGSVAFGREVLKAPKKKLSIEEKQAAAAIGQIQLMSSYRDYFAKQEIDVGQILLTASDCNSRQRYLNCQNTIKALQKNKVVPIINENDSVAVDEIKIGDNDRLAARVAQMISADALILFSDIDGLYDKNPKTHKTAKLIPEVLKVTKEIEKMAGGATSDVGTGGMTTKIQAAKMLKNSGCDVVITNGFTDNVLKKISEGKQSFTIFKSSVDVKKSRKQWISGFLNAKGEAIINECAVKALKTKRNSLLPVGVIAIKGKFEKGDAIFVKDEKGNHIGSGISSFSSTDAKKILKKNSKEVKKVLGKTSKKELIHADNLVILD